MRAYTDQLASAGTSVTEIVECALDAARPERGLRWLDIGCGRGDLLRRIRDRWEPAALCGIDPIGWLDDDLRGDVVFHQVAAEEAANLPMVDRVMMVSLRWRGAGGWKTYWPGWSRNSSCSVVRLGVCVSCVPSKCWNSSARQRLGEYCMAWPRESPRRV